MNKYTFRRFIFGLITIPIAMGLYFLVWLWLIACGAQGTFAEFKDNLPLISAVWVVGWTFGPQIIGYFEKLVGEHD